MPVLNASSSQGASAGATSSQGGASSRGKFEKNVLKVSWIQDELMRSSFVPKCQPKITRISALEVL